MNFKDQYRTAFSRVHTAVTVREEDFVMRKKKTAHRMRKSVMVLAAAICLLLACSATALAMNLFGLKDLVLHGDGTVAPAVTTGNPGPAASGEITPPTELISLQGFAGSDEYKAELEWGTFLATYDQDGSLLAKVGNGPTGLSDRYSQYLVYTQEMADKLDEITAKYNLKLHSQLDVLNSKEELYTRLGTGDFLGPYITDCGPYIYEDGTFHIDGSAVLPGGKSIGLQIMNCVKGSFTDTMLNVGDAASYTEWSYKTASGVTVCLATGPDKCLLFADLDHSFVTFNILEGTDAASGGLTADDLQTLADSVDFSMLNGI